MITENELIEAIKDAMDIEYDIEHSKNLKELEEWDSLAVLTLLSFFHDNGVDIEVEDVEEANSIDDFIRISING